MTIIFSDVLVSHIRYLNRVLFQLQAAGFTLRGFKCSFGMNSTTHVNFEYSGKGVRPSTEKVHAIADWPTPRSAKEFRLFLGFANFSAASSKLC